MKGYFGPDKPDLLKKKEIVWGDPLNGCKGDGKRNGLLRNTAEVKGKVVIQC
eukprot:gene12297-4235_t